MPRPCIIRGIVGEEPNVMRLGAASSIDPFGRAAPIVGERARVTHVAATMFGAPLPPGGTVGVCSPSGPYYNRSDIERPVRVVAGARLPGEAQRGRLGPGRLRRGLARAARRRPQRAVRRPRGRRDPGAVGRHRGDAGAAPPRLRPDRGQPQGAHGVLRHHEPAHRDPPAHRPRDAARAGARLDGHPRAHGVHLGLRARGLHEGWRRRGAARPRRPVRARDRPGSGHRADRRAATCSRSCTCSARPSSRSSTGPSSSSRRCTSPPTSSRCTSTSCGSPASSTASPGS